LRYFFIHKNPLHLLRIKDFMKIMIFSRMRNGILALGLLMLLISCTKEEVIQQEDKDDIIKLSFATKSSSFNNITDRFCAVFNTNLLVSQKEFKDAEGTTPYGQVSFYKDAQFLYITQRILNDDDNYFISKTKLEVGHFTTTGKKNNPAPGLFKYNEELVTDEGTGRKAYTYKLDLSELAGKGNLHFAVYAEVVEVQLDEDGNFVMEGEYAVVKRHGAWAKGIAFNQDGKGNWAQYVNYNVDQECKFECDPTFAQTFYLEKTNGAETATYNIFSNGEAVGTVKLVFNPASHIIAEFSINEDFAETITFKAVGLKYNLSEVVDTDFSATPLVEAPDDEGNWQAKYMFVTDSNKIFGAFYVELDGVCTE
jgi:hypothetical protein